MNSHAVFSSKHSVRMGVTLCVSAILLSCSAPSPERVSGTSSSAAAKTVGEFSTASSPSASHVADGLARALHIRAPRTSAEQYELDSLRVAVHSTRWQSELASQVDTKALGRLAMGPHGDAFPAGPLLENRPHASNESIRRANSTGVVVFQWSPDTLAP